MNNNDIDIFPVKKKSDNDKKIEENNLVTKEVPVNQNSNFSSDNNSLEEKENNTLEIGLLVILILEIIGIVLKIKNGFSLSLIMDIYIALILYLGYKKAKEKKTVAVKYGIAIGIILLIFGSFIFGIFTLFDAINYNRKLKNIEKPKNEWLNVLYIIVTYIVLAFILALISTVGILNQKLQCTRNNGDKVEYRFNKEGVSDVIINGKSDNVETDYINSNYYSSFEFYRKNYEDNPIKEYINIMQNREEVIYDSVCK